MGIDSTLWFFNNDCPMCGKETGRKPDGSKIDWYYSFPNMELVPGLQDTSDKSLGDLYVEVAGVGKNGKKPEETINTSQERETPRQKEA